MAISSTTFNNLRSCGSFVEVSSNRPPSDSATALPPLESWAVLNRLPPMMTASVPPAAKRKILGSQSEKLIGRLVALPIIRRALEHEQGNEINAGDDEHDRYDEVEREQLRVLAGLILALEEVHLC
jgi:hypothetical protein